METTLRTRIAGIPRELKLFLTASFAMSTAYSLIDATMNNFLNAHFTLSGFERSFLELPRELPGFLVVFVSAMLWFLSSRRLGVFAMLLGAVGALLIGFVSSTYALLVVCLFVFSMGQHIFIPLSSTIGMELAQEGRTGRRLGQLNALRNLAAIVGSFVVFLGFKFLGFSFQLTFVLSAIGLTAAAALLFSMKPEKAAQPKVFLKLHKEYWLYYLMSVLFGSRKQLFITFAPWVIVNVFNKDTQTMATLVTIGGVIGILFQPLLGRAIDRFGERVVLAGEAVMLVLVCFGYGFSKFMFPQDTAFLMICGFYLLDQMLFSVNMARATYMKKIAIRPEDVQPALTASVTLDHLFSIVVALIGGAIWNAFGFQYVFLMGVFIAAANFVAALRVRVPKPV